MLRNNMSSEVIEDADLKNYCTLRCGGKAKILIKVSKISCLQSIIKLLNDNNKKYTVIGNGSNIIFDDGEIGTVIIKLSDEFDEIKYTENIVKVGAGYNLRKLAKEVSKKGLSGLEFAGGIPATVGGAVYMNAGAHSGDMSTIVKSVTAIDKQTGTITNFSNKMCNFSYRKSIFQNTNNIIVEVEIILSKGDNASVFKRMSGNLAYREEVQPLNYPSFGSVFRNPSNHHAGSLIEDAGLKGLTIGGAQISEKHANFIINTGNAKSSDVLKLIDEVKKNVYKNFQITLETEVELIGFDDE